jgi:hypothetical protein
MTCPVCKKFSSPLQWVTVTPGMGLYGCPNCGAVNFPRAIFRVPTQPEKTDQLPPTALPGEGSKS